MYSVPCVEGTPKVKYLKKQLKYINKRNCKNRRAFHLVYDTDSTVECEFCYATSSFLSKRQNASKDTRLDPVQYTVISSGVQSVENNANNSLEEIKQTNLCDDDASDMPTNPTALMN
jgi:hypothetical protein